MVEWSCCQGKGCYGLVEVVETVVWSARLLRPVFRWKSWAAFCGWQLRLRDNKGEAVGGSAREGRWERKEMDVWPIVEENKMEQGG